MNDYVLEAREELKRLEHIIYVSLKYSRTVDVIINALNRLVNVYELLIEAFLEKARQEGVISSLPKSPARRGVQLGELFPEEALLQKHLLFYQYLKNILKSNYAKREEYRRHVTHIVELDKATSEMNIDTLENCEHFAHQFLRHAEQKLLGRHLEDD